MVTATMGRVPQMALPEMVRCTKPENEIEELLGTKSALLIH